MITNLSSYDISNATKSYPSRCRVLKRCSSELSLFQFLFALRYSTAYIYSHCALPNFHSLCALNEFCLPNFRRFLLSVNGCRVNWLYCPFTKSVRGRITVPRNGTFIRSTSFQCLHKWSLEPFRGTVILPLILTPSMYCTVGFARLQVTERRLGAGGGYTIGH